MIKQVSSEIGQSRVCVVLDEVQKGCQANRLANELIIIIVIVIVITITIIIQLLILKLTWNKSINQKRHKLHIIIVYVCRYGSMYGFYINIQVKYGGYITDVIG